LANRIHTNLAVCFQILFQMMAGYHNQDDSDDLRHD
jgi:hypothetical protein